MSFEYRSDSEEVYTKFLSLCFYSFYSLKDYFIKASGLNVEVRMVLNESNLFRGDYE